MSDGHWEGGRFVLASTTQQRIRDLLAKVAELESGLAKTQAVVDRQRLKIAELEIPARISADMMARAQAAEATLAAIRELPGKWRKSEQEWYDSCPDGSYALAGDMCADELRALLDKANKEHK